MKETPQVKMLDKFSFTLGKHNSSYGDFTSVRFEKSDNQKIDAIFNVLL